MAVHGFQSLLMLLVMLLLCCCSQFYKILVDIFDFYICCICMQLIQLGYTYLLSIIIINPMKIIIVILLATFFIHTLHFSIQQSSPRLSQINIALQHMISSYQLGDTSLAFSIAVKVYLAVQTLHEDLKMEARQSSRVPLSGVNCEESLSKIVGMCKSPFWQQHFQDIISQIGLMQTSCTNSNFNEIEKQDDSSIESGFQNQCALCVVLLRVMQNYVNYHRVDVTNFVNVEFCSLFEDNIKPTCQAFIHFSGPIIIQTLYKKEPSDKVCLMIGLCKDHNCRIVKAKMQEYNIDESQFMKAPAPWKWLIHFLVDHFGNGHFPIFDVDNDTYSDVSTFRGYHWRGSDCNEMQASVYPGRKNGSKLLDYDCNGIFGLDNRGRLYEDKFCAPYKRYGIAVIGDSAGAHFSIPQRFFNVTMMKKGTFKDLLPRLADELDIPHQSGYTGHTNTSYASHSVYKYLRDWNLCNHNDFQNIGVNGATAGNSWGNIQALKRNQTHDYPLIMFLQLIGNDVCKKSFDSMTKPQDFKRGILKLLDFIDKTVPEGSHLVMLGLGDGDVLYDNLHADIHPLNVTYGNVYDFLNCLEISPCWGWLNSNETVRKFTTERAKNLSKVYNEILKDHTYKNFDVVYYDFPSLQILERKVMEGGDPKEMVQRCDGFHPNVQFNSYLADWLWMKIRTEHSDWIGPKNPHNEQIRNIFGLQILK